MEYGQKQAFLDLLKGLPTLKLLGVAAAQGAVVADAAERYRKSTMSVLRVAFLSSVQFCLKR